MPNMVLDLIIDRVDLVNAGANSEAFIELYKGKESAKSMPMTFDQIISELKPEHAEVINSEIAKAKAEIPEETSQQLEKAMADLATAVSDREALEGQLQEVKKTRDEEATVEELMKGLDPSVQEVFKKQQAKIAAAEAAAKQLNDEKLEAENLAKARDLKALPIEEVNLAKMMIGITPEMHDLLKSVNKLIEDSPAFKEFGKAGTGENATGDDAWAKIEKKAKEIAVERKITEAAATAAVIKEFPQLYKDYLERSND